MFPIPNPPATSLPHHSSGSSQYTSPKHPAPCLSTQPLLLLPFLFLSCTGLPQGPSLPSLICFVFHFLWLHFLCKHTLFIYIRHEYPIITAALPPEYLLETFWVRWSPKGPKQPLWYQIIKRDVVYQMSGWHWQGTSRASPRGRCFTLPRGIIMILPIVGLGRMLICCISLVWLLNTSNGVQVCISLLHLLISWCFWYLLDSWISMLLTDWWIFLDFIDYLWS